MDNSRDQIILVDEQDNEVGSAGKMEAHREGKLHRAFSIFILNSDEEVLLQKRADDKYHSGGLWTNTCCGHPRVGEELEEAARRRLQEEMGFDCPLKYIHGFVYKTEFGNGLIEYEYDHIFTGLSDAKPYPDSKEISEWKYVDARWLKTDMKKHPEKYTYWIKNCYGKVLDNLSK